MEAPKPRRRAITIQQRAALRRYASSHPRLRQPQLASWFEEQFGHRLSQGTVSESLSKRFAHLDALESTAFLHDQKKIRASRWPELEELLFEWFLNHRPDVPISDKLLRSKAEALWKTLPESADMEAPPRFSNGWVERFKKRHAIRGKIQHREEPPKVTTKEALAALATLRLYEEQQEDGSFVFVEHLDKYEQLVAQRHRDSLQEASIATFFADM